MYIPCIANEIERVKEKTRGEHDFDPVAGRAADRALQPIVQPISLTDISQVCGV